MELPTRELECQKMFFIAELRNFIKFNFIHQITFSLDKKELLAPTQTRDHHKKEYMEIIYRKADNQVRKTTLILRI